MAAPRRRGRLLAGALAAVLLGLLACSVPGPRRAPPTGGGEASPAPRTASAAIAGVKLQDRTGPVAPDVKARELARLRAEGRSALVQHHLAVMAADGDAELYRGNDARLLIDGPQTFAAMKAAIARARHRVLLEMYIIEDDGVGVEFAQLLLRKAAEGVRVALMYDAVGSRGTAGAFFDRLERGGIAVCAYNPVNPLERPGHWGLVQRNHRKTLVADSDAAFTGGINLSDVFVEGSFRSAQRAASPATGEAADDEGWRDTTVELRGPAVAAIATLFRESWERQGCKAELPPAPRPLQATPGQRVVRVVAGDPRVTGVNPAYAALMAAVRAARESVHLTMAYFAPGPDMVETLADAARRGVEVVLVLPGRTDVRMVLHAARSYYARLLGAGVRIHEMRGTVVHAKTAVIDGVFSTVGSSNLDWRSIVINNEIDVIVLGDDFGRAMEAQFERDVAMSTPIDPRRWEQRGVAQRLLEALGRMVEPLL